MKTSTSPVEFNLKSKDGIVSSSNITPDIETGIGRWTKEDFLNRFKEYTNKISTVKPGELNTPMPWGQFAGMKDEDISAIYDYLKTIPPVHHKVDRFVQLNQK